MRKSVGCGTDYGRIFEVGSGLMEKETSTWAEVLDAAENIEQSILTEENERSRNQERGRNNHRNEGRDNSNNLPRRMFNHPAPRVNTYPSTHASSSNNAGRNNYGNGGQNRLPENRNTYRPRGGTVPFNQRGGGFNRRAERPPTSNNPPSYREAQDARGTSRCYLCGGEGHFSCNCPSTRTTRTSGP